MYIHICKYIYIYMYIYIHPYTYTSIYIYIHTSLEMSLSAHFCHIRYIRLFCHVSLNTIFSQIYFLKYIHLF